MSYIENPFTTGDLAECINDNFPIVATTHDDKSRIGNQATVRPHIGKVSEVAEVLGEFIRFDEYDENDPENPEFGWRWWKHTHFRKLTYEEYQEYFPEVTTLTNPRN